MAFHLTPQDFTPTYQIYEENLEHIAVWLVKTSAIYGSVRLKGKERKKAKKRKEANSGEEPEFSLAEVKIRQFPGLTRKIIDSHGGLLDVPVDILKAAQDVIELREKWDQFICRSSSSTGHQKPYRATPYLEAMKETIDILKRNNTSVEPDQPIINGATSRDCSLEARHDQSRIAGVAELHEYLNMIPPIMTDREITAIADASNPSYHHVFQHEPDQGMESFCLALYCFFKDINDVRKYIRDVWIQVSERQMDFMYASVMTETAVDLIQCIEDRFLITWVLDRTGEHAMNLFYAFVHMIRNGRLKETSSKIPLHDWLDGDDADIAKWCYIPVKTVLRRLIDLLPTGELRRVELDESMNSGLEANTLPESYASINDLARKLLHLLSFGESTRAKLDDSLDLKHQANIDERFIAEKHGFAEDSTAFVEAFNDWVSLAAHEELSEVDCPTAVVLKLRKVRDLGKESEVTVELCFAFQVYTDIVRTLQHYGEEGFRAFLRYSRFTRQRLEEVLEVHKSDRHWLETAGEICRLRLAQIQSQIEKDVFLPTRSHLLCRYPQLSGILQYYLALDIREASLVVVDMSGSVPFTAHLYNALRQTSHLKIQWPKLEQCILLLSLENQTSDRQRLNAIPTALFLNEPPRSLQECGAECNILLQVYKRIFDTPGRKLGDGLEAVSLEGKTMQPSPQKQTEPHTKLSNGISECLVRQPDALTLLGLVEKEVEAQCVNVTHDHIAMHFIYLKLLRQLREALGDTLCQIRQDYVIPKTRLPLFAGDIIITAVISREKHGAGAEDAILGNAAAVMKDFIQEESARDSPDITL